MYFCVGGTEVANDGICDESNCFMRTDASDNITAKRRLRIVSSFDTIITMGTRAATFFRNHGITAELHVVSGGIDPLRFRQTRESQSDDLILVARLSVEKRIDVFLRAVRCVADRFPGVKAVIVGDGRLREELQLLAEELHVGRNVRFVGHRDDVEECLHRSKIFVLTSDLEGLPLSVMEAMMCGLPAIVSNVGDLADLIENGTNGYLVPRRSPEMVAGRIIDLLSCKQKMGAFSEAARRSAMRYATNTTIERWDQILAGFRKALA
jgi:glycosyltransferase involved in cell wall biosynthesis